MGFQRRNPPRLWWCRSDGSRSCAAFTTSLGFATIRCVIQAAVIKAAVLATAVITATVLAATVFTILEVCQGGQASAQGGWVASC